MGTGFAPRLVYIVTHPVSANLLLKGQLAHMRAAGFEVTLVSSPGPELETVRAREGIETLAVPMKREIDPARDAAALARLAAVLGRIRPHIVNASTPKGGLVGMVAARAVGVPVRVYLLRGLRLETSRGPLRAVLGAAERVTAACAHRVVCVSESLRRLYVGRGFAPEAKTRVLGSGSSNGVDAVRFDQTTDMRERARALRESLGIAADAPVIGFVGRLVADKGIVDLLDAFDSVRAIHPEARLLLLGDNLAGDSMSPALTSRLRETKGAMAVGTVADPAPYYGFMDVLAFPSLREGFPNVPMEAAAAGIPVAGFRATGVVDAVEDGRTGLLVDKGDTRALASSLCRYLADPELRRVHGQAGRERALRVFSQRAVWDAWVGEYMRLLDARGLPGPKAERR